MKIFNLIIITFSVLILSCNNTAKPLNSDQKSKKNTLRITIDTTNNYLNTIAELGKIVDTANITKYNIEIEKYLKEDSINGIKFGQILFVGSSSIRKWKTLEQDFSPFQVINRGFGGSSVPEVIFYSPKIVLPYKPKKIFFYAGENDIAWNKNSPETVKQTFILFSKMIHFYLPKTKIYFISIKPSLAREEYNQQFIETNKMLKSYIENYDYIKYIDVYSKMLTSEGKIIDDIFIKDKLHLNEKGYSIWKNEILKYL